MAEYKADVSGIPEMIHEVGCYGCDWNADRDAAYGPQQVLKDAKHHVVMTGHHAWKHSIRMFSIDPVSKGAHQGSARREKETE